MSNLDYIKSYLIRLGVDINPGDLSKWDNSLKKIDKGFKSTVKNLVSSYSKISGIFASTSIAIGKFVESIAQSDMEMQRFAQRMYMSRDSAKALQTTLDSMGLDGIQDLQDVALNPELTKQYRELIDLSQSLTTPKAVKESLKDIRSISQEFNKLQTIITYFMERVAHFIYQTASTPAKKFQQFLNNFNTKFSKNISNWAESLGKVLGSILRLSLRLGEALVSIIGSVKDLWDSLSGLSKGFIGAIFLINRIIKGSPIWRLMTIFSSFLLLLDDYKTYREGGISAKILKPVWGFVDKQREDPDSGWNFLVNSIKNLIDGLKSLIKMFTDFLNDLKTSRFGKIFGLDNKNSTMIGDNIRERLTNHIDYIKNTSLLDRTLSGISGGRLGISPQEYYESRLHNFSKSPMYTPIPNVNNNTITNNYTPIPKEDKISQNFIFNISGISNPNQFVNEVSTLIRNNKSRLVG